MGKYDIIYKNKEKRDNKYFLYYLEGYLNVIWNAELQLENLKEEIDNRIRIEKMPMNC